jgi:hypothetical protein
MYEDILDLNAVLNSFIMLSSASSMLLIFPAACHVNQFYSHSNMACKLTILFVCIVSFGAGT